MYAGNEGCQIANAAKARAITDAVHMSLSIAHQGYERPGAKKRDLHQAVNEALCCRLGVAYRRRGRPDEQGATPV
jgi:hypothetical protein